MRMTTVLGLLIGIGGILLGNVLEGGHVGSLMQGAALVIVLSGTFGAVLLSCQAQDLHLAWTLCKSAFRKEDNDNEIKTLQQILELARLARKESILAIEARLNNLKDPFMRDVFRTVVDGVDPSVIRSVIEREIDTEEERLMAGAKVWSEAGGYAPTVGIIGAVLGLIHVMGNLTDTSKLGSGIAVAFVATIYGVGFANLIFLPMGNKIKRLIQRDVRLKEMILDGALCIQSGYTPSLTEMKLKSYLEKQK